MKLLLNIFVFCVIMVFTSCSSSQRGCGCPKFGKVDFNNNADTETLSANCIITEHASATSF